MMKTLKILVLAMALTGLCVGNASAQGKGRKDVEEKVIDNTPDSINKALSARPAPGATRRNDNPVLFLIGNSTMRNGTLGNGNNGQWGWGYFAHKYFDDNKISVENQALGGMSTRTFYNKLWGDIRKALKPGDWVIVSIGHNDNGPLDEGRARNVLPGIGDESKEVTIKETGEKETVWTYGGYMRKYVSEIRAAGANPILMSLTPRNAYGDDGKIVRKPQGAMLEQLGKELDVPYIDLNEISGAKLDGFGEWKTNYHFTSADKIHTSKFGAELNARSAAEGIMECQHPVLAPLKAMLKDLTLPTVIVNREEGKPVVFTVGDSTVKNEDRDDNSMWGWCSVLDQILNPKKCSWVNCGKAGRSTRSFMNEGRWEQVYNSLKPGDYVIINFGHNDTGDIDKGRERGVMPGGGDETKVFKMESNGRYEMVYTFGFYLKMYIQDAREKGATPIIVSHTPRNRWKDGKVENCYDELGVVYRQVAEETGCDYIDLNAISAEEMTRLYKDKDAAQAQWFKKDGTHMSKFGATHTAKNFAKGVKNSKCTLKKLLK